jgi:hypothetical protein
VPAQVLSPARELPAVPLCSVAPVRTANGNVWPLFCRGGAINVQAWRFYAGLTPSVLAAGSKATSSEAYAALCRDAYVTNVEREYGFELAAAYYGWKFSLDPTRVSCQ